MAEIVKKKIAVIEFPGLNSEFETARAVREAGMDAEIFRWNADALKLADFDGYVIPGGFSYEDRGRAGLIASMDPVMNVLRAEVLKGKPLLGICNGAQIVIETGLVPGNGELGMCLANNKRVDQDGHLVGTGFINYDQTIHAAAREARCAFNIGIPAGGKIFVAPIAHGEGRFTTIDESVKREVVDNDQIIFKYCDTNGKEGDFYPLNPNGALYSAAAICNRAGNVMAIMPHPERGVKAPIIDIFISMKRYLEEFVPDGKAMLPSHDEVYVKKSSIKYSELVEHVASPTVIEIFSSLIITDNTAQTFVNTLALQGFDVNLDRAVHYKISSNYSDEDALKFFARQLIECGLLLNVNKEIATVRIGEKWWRYGVAKKELVEIARPDFGGFTLLVTDIEDFSGSFKQQMLNKENRHTLERQEATISQSVFYGIKTDVDIDSLIATNIFANKHSQKLFRYQL